MWLWAGKPAALQCGHIALVHYRCQRIKWGTDWGISIANQLALVPIGEHPERTTDHDTPGVVAQRAFCGLSDWCMSDLECNADWRHRGWETQGQQAMEWEKYPKSAPDCLRGCWLAGRLKGCQPIWHLLLEPAQQCRMRTDHLRAD